MRARHTKNLQRFLALLLIPLVVAVLPPPLFAASQDVPAQNDLSHKSDLSVVDQIRLTLPHLQQSVLLRTEPAPPSPETHFPASQSRIFLPLISKSHPNTLELVVGTAGGQIVSPQSDVTIVVPPGAVAQPTRFHYAGEALSGEENSSDVLRQFELHAWNTSTGEAVTRFAVPLKLLFHDLPPGRSDLTAATFEARRWHSLPSTPVSADGVLTALTPHLSVFALVNSNPIPGAVQIGPLIPDQPSQPGFGRFFSDIINFTYTGGPITLASTPDALGLMCTDDQVNLIINGIQRVPHPDCIIAQIGYALPIDVTSWFVIGQNTIEIEYVDLLGPLASSTGYWLVPVTVPDLIPPDISDVTRASLNGGRILVRARVTDNVAVDTNRVFLFMNGQSYNFVPVGNDYFEAIITAPQNQSSALQIQAFDQAGNLREYPSGVGRIRVYGYQPYGLGGHNTVCNNCNPGYHGTEADPVNTATGNFLYHTLDLNITGIGGMDLLIEREYNSLPNEPIGIIGYRLDNSGNPIEEPRRVHPEPFGPGWSFLLATSLVELNFGLFKGAQLRYADGHVATFEAVGNGTFRALEPRSYDILTRDGTGFRLQRRDLTTYRFDAAGQLQSISDSNGNKVILSYQGDQLVRVENNAGRALNFSYSGDRISLITGPEGKWVRYQYQNGRLSAVETPRNTTRYSYHSSGRLSAILDAPGHPDLQLSYDALGRVAEQRVGTTARFSFSYDTPARTTTITDLLGQQTFHVYDPQYRLIESRDFQGFAEYFTYDSNDHRSSFRDRRGALWSYRYDSRGNLRERHDPQAACSDLPYTRPDVTTWDYNAHDQVERVEDALGRIWEYRYDTRHNLERIIQPNLSEIRFSYNPQGQHLTMTDALGRVTHYSYDQHGNLLAVVDPLQGQTRFAYDPAGRVIAITNASNHTIRLRYDTDDNIVAIADAKGQVTRFDFDRFNQLLRQVDRRGIAADFEYDLNRNLSGERAEPNGAWIRYTYDSLYRRSVMIDRLGFTTSYGYDNLNRLETITDQAGEVTRTEYDPNDNQVALIDALGQATRTEFDATNRPATRIDAAGRRTSLCYDAEDQLLRSIGPRGETTSYTYDRFGRLASMTDTRGGVTSYEYDSSGNLTAVIDPLGHRTDLRYDDLDRVSLIEQPALRAGVRPTTSVEYDPLGNIHALITPRGNRFSYRYDPNNNLETLTDPLGNSTNFTYDPEDNLVEIIDPRGNRSTTAYNPVGLPIEVTDGEGNPTRLAYDADYNVVQLIDPSGQQTRYEYDRRGLLVGVTDALGHTTLYRRDALGRVSAMQDARGNRTSYGYDMLGQFVAITDALGGNTRYGYDEAGNLVSITDARNQTTRFGYDLRNDLVGEIDPLGNTWRYDYDLARRLIRRTDPLGRATFYEHNSNDRLVAVRYSVSVLEQAPLRFAYDLDGNQTDMCDGLGCTRNEYDALGRLIASTDWLNRVVSRSYDAAGNLSGMVYPDGSALGYAHDGANRLFEVIYPQSDSSSFTYDANSRVTSINHPNDTVTALGYDIAGRLTSLDHRRNGASTPQNQYNLTLDQVGNRTQVTETRSAFDGSARPLTLVNRYSYDRLNRLISVSTSGALTRETSYTYDAVGNRVARGGAIFAPDPGLPALPVTPRPDETNADYDAANRILNSGEASYTHDANGNRATTLRVLPGGARELTTYNFDLENRPVRIQITVDGRETLDRQIAYDGYGRRAREISRQGNAAPTITTYLYDGIDLIGEQVERGDQMSERYYYLAPSPLSGLRRPLAIESLDDGARHWYQSDGLDSVIALTDETGNLAAQLLYDEYGRLLAGDDELQSLGYTGQDYDSASGLLHFYARAYDPATGTWLSADPYRGSTAEPMTLHRYGYVGQNPVGFVDVWGFARQTVGRLNQLLREGDPRISGSSAMLKSRPQNSGFVDWYLWDETASLNRGLDLFSFGSEVGPQIPWQQVNRASGTYYRRLPGAIALAEFNPFKTPLTRANIFAPGPLLTIGGPILNGALQLYSDRNESLDWQQRTTRALISVGAGALIGIGALAAGSAAAAGTAAIVATAPAWGLALASATATVAVSTGLSYLWETQLKQPTFDFVDKNSPRLQRLLGVPDSEQPYGVQTTSIRG